MLNSILLVVITLILIFCAVQLVQIKHGVTMESVELRYYFNDSINSVLRQQNKELAKTYAEEERIASRIEMHFKQGDFNLADFADSVSKRAIVLAVDKAEFAVKLAENDLSRVRDAISNAQATLDRDIRSNFSGNIEQDKNILKELKRQEGFLEQRVNNAYTYLNKITSTILSQTSDQPESQN